MPHTLERGGHVHDLVAKCRHRKRKLGKYSVAFDSSVSCTIVVPVPGVVPVNFLGTCRVQGPLLYIAKSSVSRLALPSAAGEGRGGHGRTYSPTATRAGASEAPARRRAGASQTSTACPTVLAEEGSASRGQESPPFLGPEHQETQKKYRATLTQREK